MISFWIRLRRSIFLFFLATLFCWAAASPAQGQSASSRSAAERTIWQRNNPQFEALPLALSPQNHLIVRAFINGKLALLGVDTGAPVSAIAVSRHRHYGLDSISSASKLPPKLMINGALDTVGIANHSGSVRSTLLTNQWSKSISVRRAALPVFGANRKSTASSAPIFFFPLARCSIASAGS